MKHRHVEYTVREIEPRQWQWHIFPRGQPGPVVTSPGKFPSREAAVQACIEEINNGLERTRHRGLNG